MMENFTIHSLESAPEESKAQLKDSKSGFGSVPNLHGILAESPETLEGYKTLHELFANSSFNADELTVVWQTINVEHECHYCVPGHTMIAKSMDVDDAINNALRNGTELPDEKLQVLHETTLAITRNRGHISDEQLQAFYDAGYTRRNVLEIILGLSQKVISNYVNHIADTPLDDAAEKFAWKEAAE